MSTYIRGLWPPSTPDQSTVNWNTYEYVTMYNKRSNNKYLIDADESRDGSGGAPVVAAHEHHVAFEVAAQESDGEPRVRLRRVLDGHEHCGREPVRRLVLVRRSCPVPVSDRWAACPGPGPTEWRGRSRPPATPNRAQHRSARALLVLAHRSLHRRADHCAVLLEPLSVSCMRCEYSTVLVHSHYHS